MNETDLEHLRRCLELATQALEAGDEPFGSVLVDGEGQVRFEDHNHVASGDRTQHPELAIARWAAANLTPGERSASTVYTSGEHCPMCAAAHGWVGLGRIVYAASSIQLADWLGELGVPPPPVATLPIQQVVPGAVVEGPAEELADAIRELHLRFRQGRREWQLPDRKSKESSHQSGLSGLLDAGEPGYRGFKDYTPRFLKAYDAWVGFMAPRVWRARAESALDLYRTHVGTRHLDVGPGTGYFVVETNPAQDLELTLLDPNPHVLDHCAERLAAWNPTTVRANVLQPLPVAGPFDSAALAHVIHCLPGPMTEKARAIEHIAAVLTDDGVLFGATVLGRSADHTLAARMFLRLANLQGGFDNLGDDVDGLRAILEASFQEVEIEVPTGSLAYFVASRPRRPPSG